jgi:hypothetical protein
LEPVSKSKRLTWKQVHLRVSNRLRKLDNLNFLESFAMFMGKAQLVELSLKKILTSKYSYDENRIERPACVRKTFPNFFAKLAELGVMIQHASVGTQLSGDDLLA